MQFKTTNIILLCIFTLILVSVDPVFANKFETIGSGVSGSVKVKIEYLKIIAYVAGVIMFTAGVLSITMRAKNSQSLNYTMWKPSSIIFFILSFFFIGTGLYL
ncbi:MAG: hypothetical protein ABFS39_05675 [Pseudomonadota bacterium]